METKVTVVGQRERASVPILEPRSVLNFKMIAKQLSQPFSILQAHQPLF